jgi:hypothetical protein
VVRRKMFANACFIQLTLPMIALLKEEGEND